MSQYYVYILSNKPNGTIYIGVTSDLIKRIYQHKNELTEGFTQRYKIKNLVYYEIFEDVEEAILREKRLKRWRRKWKDELIGKDNPEWNDLYSKILGSN